MKDALLHLWRMMTEPSGEGCLFGGGMPKRWVVVYPPEPPYLPEGGRSIPMAYDSACNYAEMFNGTVECYKK